MTKDKAKILEPTVPASMLDRTAGDFVKALIDAGESYTTINKATGIEPSALSRWKNGLRQASERDWRTIAKYALEKQV